MGGDDLLDLLLLGEHRRDPLDLVAGVAQLLGGGGLELLGAAGRDREGVASSPSMWAMARPMPLEAPVTSAARSAMWCILSVGSVSGRIL